MHSILIFNIHPKRKKSAILDNVYYKLNMQRTFLNGKHDAPFSAKRAKLAKNYYRLEVKIGE